MNRADAVIRGVQVTEKGTRLGEQNKYLFEVAPWANKIDIRRAVESVFNVKVEKVNTMQYSGKRKRDRGMRSMGSRADWKRAVVTLKDGDIIDLT